MVLDLKRFVPRKQLQAGLLWVAEQLPGVVEAADMTQVRCLDSYCYIIICNMHRRCCCVSSVVVIVVSSVLCGLCWTGACTNNNVGVTGVCCDAACTVAQSAVSCPAAWLH